MGSVEISWIWWILRGFGVILVDIVEFSWNIRGLFVDLVDSLWIW